MTTYRVTVEVKEKGGSPIKDGCGTTPILTSPKAATYVAYYLLRGRLASFITNNRYSSPVLPEGCLPDRSPPSSDGLVRRKLQVQDVLRTAVS
eukprot:9487282-Pyramimonas_sp.AAC.1